MVNLSHQSEFVMPYIHKTFSPKKKGAKKVKTKSQKDRENEWELCDKYRYERS